MSPEEIDVKVKEIICQQLEVSAEQLRPEASFVDDLKADSLAVVELVLALEQEFKILDRLLQFGVVAGLMAIEDAGFADHKIREHEQEAWGCYIGAGLGGVRTIEDTYVANGLKGPRYGFSPYFVTDIIINEIPG